MKPFQILTLIAFLVMILSPRLAFAHGNLEHILGTVSSVSDKTLVVETKKGELKTIELSDSTQYIYKGNSASLDQLKKGMRVVIHAKKKGDKWEAKEVKFGAQKKAPDSTPQ
ncbi:DUF5666 domain-containing protein [Candidatus Methylacidiphilum infernorum]|uniref:Uncharacterized protein n=1 Tax=Methylacidiphilum infernorum (isolate V4) TaxID=481448 RepID=B3DZU1_METI4|nr:DUF5666 domain-containing protein [Candidatus Methylacidiphilum infernorum]ACD84276.1 Conserved hypothetical protein [Methylacidiphilum infernorum V4]